MASTQESFIFVLSAAVSGLCGALSAACGKAAGGTDMPWPVSWILYCFMVGLNAIGMIFYGKAMQRSSSLHATGAAVTASIAFSGLVGWVLYGDSLTHWWWMGLVFLSAGVPLIQPRRPPSKAKEL
jgi:drug/metabolite transporter (DMT)-like permease